MLSYRDLTFAVTGKTDLSGGFVGDVLNPYYTAKPGRRRFFPYLSDGTITSFSLRKTLEAFQMPVSGFGMPQYYPDNDGDPPYATECNGITASEDSWYLTNNPSVGAPNLWRIPFSANIDGIGTTTEELNLPGQLSNYVHFGDPCYWKEPSSGREFILVPCDSPHVQSIPGICACFEILPNGTTYWQYEEVNPVNSDGTYNFDWSGLTAWCGVNRDARIFYTTLFLGVNNDEKLRIFPFSIEINGSGDFTLSWPENGVFEGIEIREKGAAETEANMCRIQGGAVSERGHLYLCIRHSEFAGRRSTSCRDGNRHDSGRFHSYDVRYRSRIHRR
jgi:hypothetical protein